MVPYNYTEFISNLTSHVKDNHIPMSRIDDAVQRILRVKFQMGLFEHPLADNSQVHQLGSQVCTPNKFSIHFLLSFEQYMKHQKLYKRHHSHLPNKTGTPRNSKGSSAEITGAVEERQSS